MPIAEPSVQATKKPLALRNGTRSTNKEEKAKEISDGVSKDAQKSGVRITSGVKPSFNGAAVAQRMILTKKPEGIQISRSKHWKFISSYHGPYLRIDSL
jgi:hypothetical protein